jgi:hypothetical protein
MLVRASLVGKGVERAKGVQHGNYKRVERACLARSSGTTCEKSTVTPCSTRARTVRTWLGVGVWGWGWGGGRGWGTGS